MDIFGVATWDSGHNGLWDTGSRSSISECMLHDVCIVANKIKQKGKKPSTGWALLFYYIKKALDVHCNDFHFN